MHPKARRSVRLVGIGAIVLGIIGFAPALFMLGGAVHHVTTIAFLLCAGIGLALVIMTTERGTGASNAETARDIASVFFTFGTLGPLVMGVLTSGTANFLVGLVGMLVAGTIATLWAVSFMKRLYGLIPVAIVASAFMPTAVFETLHDLGGFENFGGLSVPTRLGILGLESLACLIIGYALMVRFISRVERDAARSEAELETASAIHRQIVPPIGSRVGPWSVTGLSLPSSTMGGDLIDLIPRHAGTDLVLADVTGHGVRAGVVMALTKGVLRAALSHDRSLVDALADANRVLADELDSSTFVTAVLVRLYEDAARPTEILVAGHPPALVRRADAAIERVWAHGVPLGIDREHPYASSEIELGEGDALVLYSDGIQEATDHAGRMLGLDAIERTVAATDANAAGLTRALMLAAESHAPGTPEDDRSVVSVVRDATGA